MANTSRLSLPLVAASQGQKHVTVNLSLQTLDALVQGSVIDKDLTAPPGGESNGDTYIVGPSATGDWSGHDDDIAFYNNGAYSYFTPVEGWMIYVQDEGYLYVFDGSSWVAAMELSGAPFASLGTVQSFTKTQSSTPVTLTSAASVATDGSLSNVFDLTLDQNATLANPTNLQVGATYIWRITQDGTGSRTLSYGSYFKFPGGTAPVLSLAAGSVDYLIGHVRSASAIDTVANLDFQ